MIVRIAKRDQRQLKEAFGAERLAQLGTTTGIITTTNRAVLFITAEAAINGHDHADPGRLGVGSLA